MLKDFCIVIQGPATHVDETLKSIEPYDYVYSTWDGEQWKFPCLNNVIFNEKPANHGSGNLFLQQTTTLNGLLKARQLGYKKAIKLRSDFIVRDIEKLCSSFSKRLNFLFWHDYNGGYFADYIMAGDIESLIQIWTPKKEDYIFPEKMIIENVKEMSVAKEDIRFFLNDLGEKNDIYWSKYQKSLSSYKTDKLALTYIPNEF